MRPRSSFLLTTIVAMLGLASGCESFGAEVSDGAAAATDAAPAPTPEAARDGGSYCASAGRAVADRCFDFDETDDVAAGWSEVETPAEGVVVRDTERATSAPFSMVASVPGRTARAHLRLSGVPQGASPFAIELDFFAEQFGGQGVAQLLWIRQGKLTLIVYVGESLFLQEHDDDDGFEGNSNHVQGLVTTGQWRRLRLEVRGRTASLLVDGGEACTTELVDRWTTDPVEVNVGVGYMNPKAEGAWKFRYDNVLVGAR